MDNELPSEEIEKTLWAKWFAKDFSWDALAQREWKGWLLLDDGTLAQAASFSNDEIPKSSKSATIRDYWRRGPGSGRETDTRENSEIDSELEAIGELVRSPNGVRWHVIHVPSTWQNGTATGKADADSEPSKIAYNILQRRLTASREIEAAETSFDEEEPDVRAQLQGIVLPGISRLNLRTGRSTSEIIATFEHSVFLKRVSLMRVTFESDASFGNCAFFGDAWFDRATFKGDVDFSGSIFMGPADFIGATFSATCEFKDATFIERANFRNITAKKSVSFEDANFIGEVRFTEAMFEANVSFAGASSQDIVHFDRATFCNAARLQRSAFASEVSFRDAAFVGHLNISGCYFGGAARFDGQGTITNSDAREQTISLESDISEKKNTTAGKLVSNRNFSDSRRTIRKLDASGSSFSSDVFFTDRDILTPSSFRNAQFLGLAAFHGSDLHQGVTFHGAVFEYALGKSAELKSPPEPGLRRLHRPHKALLDQAASTFAEWCARYESRRSDEQSKREEDAIKAAHRQAYINDPSIPQNLDSWRSQAAQAIRDARFADLEAAYRTLKLKMEQSRDRMEEARFFKLELMARRRRRDDAVPNWERIFSDIYGVSSDYGNSILRPIIGLLLISLTFSALYWSISNGLSGRSFAPISAWANGEMRIDADFWEALRFSSGRVLPFGVFNDLKPEGWIGNLLAGNGSKFWSFTIRLIATVQSLAAIVLAFLFALAVRRRFQIN